MATLKSKPAMLKENLKTNTKKLKYQKKIIECKKINRRCYKDPKNVHRAMRGSTITTKTIQSKQNVETFWKGIWNNPSECNTANVDWMKQRENNYCINTTRNVS